MSNIFIIAGGPSMKGRDLSNLYDKGVLIGVNESCLLHKVHIGLTMDRLWLENRHEEVRKRNIDFYVRECVYNKWLKNPEVSGWGRVHPYPMLYDKKTLSTHTRVIHGRNSGFCAFNLAFHLQPEKVFLFGFDLGGDETHYYDNYEWSKYTNGDHYKKWANDFDDAYHIFREHDIEVYNVSMISTIKKIPKISYKECLKLV